MQPFLTSRNRRLYVKLTPLVENREEESVLGADVAAGASTITVVNINKFAVNKILLIGEFGEEKSEIIKTHASSAPSGTTVTLASNTVFAHPAGTKVYVIEYDQVELSHVTAIGGSKTLLTTTAGSGLVALEADETEMVYRETEFTTGWYHARFKNSIGGTFGSYTDPIPAAGFAANTFGYVVDYALKQNGVQLSDDISIDWFIQQGNSCLKNIQGKMKRWPKHQSLNTDIGNTTAGTNTVAMPTDAYDQITNKSVLAVRIGDGSNMRYVDPDEFEEEVAGLTKTTVSTEASAGDTTLVVADAGDLADSGTIDVWVSAVKYSIIYTGITRATNTLTGIPASGTGSITVTTPVSSVVLQNARYGAPEVYTIRGGYIEFFPIPDDTYDYKNIWADYWTVVDTIDSETDELDTERYDMVKFWLTWMVRNKVKNEGKLDLNDGDYTMYREALNDAIRTSVSGRKFKMTPKINGISYRNTPWKRAFRPPTK